jgi:uncharacterized protein (DUF2141 family)
MAKTENGRLDKNVLDVPTIPYGFSNNVQGFPGPPAFREAVMQITASDNAVRIVLNHP